MKPESTFLFSLLRFSSVSQVGMHSLKTLICLLLYPSLVCCLTEVQNSKVHGVQPLKCVKMKSSIEGDYLRHLLPYQKAG